MSKFEQLYYVLWASGFEEEMAAIFITELRRVNWRVKLVGLTKRATSGAHGLALVPDLSVDEGRLYIANVAWIVIPCASSSFKYMQTDPRLPLFIQGSQPDIIITGVLNKADRSFFPPECRRVEVDPTNERLIEIVRTMVAMNV